MTSGEPLRFADILTTASAIANYLGAPEVIPAHLRDAIRLLRDEIAMESLGRPRSPLVRGPGGAAGAGATSSVRAFAQRWFAELGDANAEIDGGLLERFVSELTEMESQDSANP